MIQLGLHKFQAVTALSCHWCGTWGKMLKANSSCDGSAGTGQLPCLIPCGNLPVASLHAQIPGKPLSRSIIGPWCPVEHICFHYHVYNFCFRGVAPQLQTRNATAIISISSWNNHLAIIFPLMCVFLESTSATLQNRFQSQHFPTAFKTSGACKPLWSGKTGLSFQTLQAAENNKHTFPQRSLSLHNIVAKFTRNYGWQFSRLFWF